MFIYACVPERGAVDEVVGRFDRKIDDVVLELLVDFPRAVDFIIYMEIFLRLEFALGPRWVNRTTT